MDSYYQSKVTACRSILSPEDEKRDEEVNTGATFSPLVSPAAVPVDPVLKYVPPPGNSMLYTPPDDGDDMFDTMEGVQYDTIYTEPTDWADGIFSPMHSRHISPRLLPEPSEPRPPPIPEINIDFAPPSRVNSEPPASRTVSSGGLLTPGDRARNRSPNLKAPSRRSEDSNRDYILDLVDPLRADPPKTARTAKHPATFQCTLCPKRFTRAYNLRSHLRTHTDERPFVCSVCGKAFARQHDKKRHEGLHSGEKKFVCRGSLQDESSWGCGRRFARADALARHFRSEAGQICIKPLWDEERESLNQPEGPSLGESSGSSTRRASSSAVPQIPKGLLQRETTSIFPAALIAQYPALAGIMWDDFFRSGEDNEGGSGTITDESAVLSTESEPVLSKSTSLLSQQFIQNDNTEYDRGVTDRIGSNTGASTRSHKPEAEAEWFDLFPEEDLGKESASNLAMPLPKFEDVNSVPLGRSAQTLFPREAPSYTMKLEEHDAKAVAQSDQKADSTPNPMTVESLLSDTPPMDPVSEGQTEQPSVPTNDAAMKPMLLNSTQSDSGYHSGGGTDTESICSIESTGSSLGLPQNFLQDFIAFFGETLIQKAGAQKWVEYTLAHHRNEEIEKRLSALLKTYAVDMASSLSKSENDDLTDMENSNQDPEHVRMMLDGAAKLVRRYRPKIARYFCNNSISEPVNAASLSDRLKTLGHQLSLMERFNLFDKSAVNQKDTVLVDPIEEEDEEDEEAGEDETIDEEMFLAEIGLIQDCLVSSKAFEQLASELRRDLYQDDRREMKAISEAVRQTDFHHHLTSPSRLEAQFAFTICWDISGFMHSQYGEVVPIATVVALTGSAFYAQATTCGEYVRTNWPSSGPVLLDILDRSLASEYGYAKVETVFDDCSPCLTMLKGLGHSNTLHVQDASPRVVVELAQLLAWVGSALSVSPFGAELAYARPVLESKPLREPKNHEARITGFNITFQHTRLHTTEVACWLPLFNGASIASGFPIPNRTEEVGLEVPLEILAGLAGVRHAMEFDGGVVLKGFSHMFVPVQKTDDRVQWHAITSEDSENRLTYEEGLSRCKSRALLEEVSLSDLQSTRAIVGWCCVATSRLGSDAANYENIDYSGAKEAGSTLRCAGGQVGLQQIGTGILDFRLGAKDGSFHLPRLGRYQKIVSAAEKTPVVLYGTKEQRGWLVFASDVILHMIQHRHCLEPFEIAGKRVKLDTTVTTGSSAKSVLIRNEKTSVSDDKDYTFKDVVSDLWSTLERLVDQNTIRSQNISGAPVKATFREFLQGYEFKAVVEERSPFNLKEKELNKTNGGWPLLVRDINALVLLADGFGEVLLPAEDTKGTLCRLWHSVPSNLDYLATTSKILKDLYNVAGCRITRKYLTSTQLRWHRGESSVFEACENAKACRCNRLQQIVPKASIGTIVSPGIIKDEGAVIFGQSGSLLQDFCSRPRQKSVQMSGIYSQPNIHLDSAEVQPNLEDTFLSDHSGQSGSDGTSDSVPASLSTCTTLSTNDTLPDISDLGMDTMPPPCSKKRLYLADSQVRLSNEHRESYTAFENEQMLRTAKRNRFVNAGNLDTHSYES